MIAALALALSLQQDPAVLDAPAWESASWRVSLPRPFDDWVFAPATSRGTTTVIFQPRSGALSDQLWGVLILTRWGGPVPLAGVADRRLRQTWRPVLGSAYTLLARDSLTFGGWPAMHLAMTGAIAHAVLDVEEYLVARGRDLVVLQLRYPRGVPRDSIASGYRRVIEGLRLGGVGGAVVAASGRASAWRLALSDSALRFDLPESLRAVAPGLLDSDAVSGGRRVMVWRPLVGDPDSSLYVVGRYHAEARRIGRLTVTIWRSDDSGTALARASDEQVALIARAWSVYWRAFGPLPTAEVSLVETAWPATRGAAGGVFLGNDASPSLVARELSRTWWGGRVPGDSVSGALVREWFPAFSSSLVVHGEQRDSGAAALERARALAGGPRFREAVRAFVAESRGGSAAVSTFRRLLGDAGGGAIP